MMIDLRKLGPDMNDETGLRYRP